MASPALAVVGRREQAVDDFAPRFGRGVGEEVSQFRGRGRQPGDVEGDAAQEVGFGSGCGRDEFAGFESGEEEEVDRRGWPAAIAPGR